MSYWSRIVNVFRPGRIAREIDEEIASHIAEAIEQGREPAEARRAFGPVLHIRERSHDVRLAARLDALRADIVFGWRQLSKNHVTSAAAILSLALAMGACLAVFGLLDAMVLRPLPVANPGRLFVLTYPRMNAAGQIETAEPFDYPQFRVLRAAVAGDAELLAVSPPARAELTFGTDDQMERLRLQFVSGWMFQSFGLKPALGRLLLGTDDVAPGASPVAVLSWNAWTGRFARDPNVIGHRFRFRDVSYEIIGVAPAGFNGTDPGYVTDLFVPSMMNATLINQKNFAWFRVFVQLARGVSPELVRQKLVAAERADRLERVKNQHWPRERYQHYIASELFLDPAAAGYSALQRQYRSPLGVLALVVSLVLLIACVNVANLMTGRAQSRAGEMALRVSIGAGRSRLVQLVLVESALVGGLACGLGSLFAVWVTPFLVRQISPPFGPPLAIGLHFDWRVAIFTAALVWFATLALGGIPALRVSGVKPAAALRGETGRSRRRSMDILVGAQVAFCVLVLFVTALFAASYRRLNSQHLGFDPDRLTNLVVVTRPDAPLAAWEEVRRDLQNVPGVASVAMATWPLMYGPVWSEPVFVDGKPPLSEEANFLATSADWLRTLRIPLLSGRELRDGDAFPGIVLVNQAFARQYFDGADPVGRSFRTKIAGKTVTCAIVGLTGDARYADMRQSLRATVYVAYTTPQFISPGNGTFVVRTSLADPMSLLSTLRQRVSKARGGFRVTETYSQDELISQHTIRERLLAMMALFFATVALVLSMVGLYGVLSYSVLDRRREIGIRMALGAPAGSLAGSLVSGLSIMLLPGAIAGLAGGIASQRYFGALLFQTAGLDRRIIGLTLAVTFAVIFAAALPAIRLALRTDPASTLRAG